MELFVGVTSWQYSTCSLDDPDAKRYEVVGTDWKDRLDFYLPRNVCILNA